MTSRRFIRCASLSLALCCAGCSSKPVEQGASSLPSSSQADKSSAPAATPVPAASPATAPPAAAASPAAAGTPAPSPTPPDAALSYAKNPERFRKYEVQPAPFNITDPKTAQEHFNVGVNLDNKKEPSKAIEEYGKALELQPEWALAHFRMAQDYEKVGRPDDAIAHWELATKYDPQFYKAYDILAAAYERKGNIPKAIETYSKLLKYPPAEIPAHYQLGLWYAQIGDRKNARQHLEQYRQLATRITAEKESTRYQTATRELKRLDR